MRIPLVSSEDLPTGPTKAVSREEMVKAAFFAPQSRWRWQHEWRDLWQDYLSREAGQGPGRPEWSVLHDAVLVADAIARLYESR